MDSAGTSAGDPVRFPRWRSPSPAFQTSTRRGRCSSVCPGRDAPSSFSTTTKISNSSRSRGCSIVPKARCDRTTAEPSTGSERNSVTMRMTDHELDRHLRRTLRAVAATVEAGAGVDEAVRVLVVDDQELFRLGLGMLLGLEPGIDVVARAVRVVADGQSLISPSMAVKLIDEFKQMGRAVQEQVPGLRLTERELEVLRLVATGMNNRAIADQLFISENTVKNHVRNILEKLQLHSRMEAVMYALRENLLDLP